MVIYGLNKNIAYNVCIGMAKGHLILYHNFYSVYSFPLPPLQGLIRYPKYINISLESEAMNTVL